MRRAQNTRGLGRRSRNRNGRRRSRNLCSKNIRVLAVLIRRRLHYFHDGVLQDAVPDARNNDIPRESPGRKGSRLRVATLSLFIQVVSNGNGSSSISPSFSNLFFLYQDRVWMEGDTVVVVRVRQRELR